MILEIVLVMAFETRTVNYEVPENLQCEEFKNAVIEIAEELSPLISKKLTLECKDG